MKLSKKKKFVLDIHAQDLANCVKYRQGKQAELARAIEVEEIAAARYIKELTT